MAWGPPSKCFISAELAAFLKANVATNSRAGVCRAIAVKRRRSSFSLLIQPAAHPAKLERNGKAGK